jgi:hypothetical protein
MPAFRSAAEIAAYLSAQGFEIAATGGGFDAWFLARPTGRGQSWHVSLTSARDMADLQPGEPLTIALESPDGQVAEATELQGPDAIPAALQGMLAQGRSRYGEAPPLAPTKAGELTLDVPQQRWAGDDIKRQALFAGQEMMAIRMEDSTYRLSYLGFAAAGFPSMEAAVAAAPGVARSVLSHMQTMVHG